MNNVDMVKHPEVVYEVTILDRSRKDRGSSKDKNIRYLDQADYPLAAAPDLRDFTEETKTVQGITDNLIDSAREAGFLSRLNVNTNLLGEPLTQVEERLRIKALRS
jgi:hypothetical protein